MRLFKQFDSEPRIVRMLKSALLCVLIVIIILIVCTSVIGVEIEHSKYPPLLGNQPENIQEMKSHVDPSNFSFAVMGDVKGSTSTFESLLHIAEKEDPSFIIILGDFVSQTNQVNHKLFAHEISDYASKTPFFVIPGNHDIGLEESFGLEEFDKTYGSAQFNFSIGSNLFIFLNDLPEYNQNGEYLDYLEKTLQVNAEKTKRTFLFMHIPPAGLSESLKCSFATDSEHFIEIAKKYHVDYVFTGHHHGYIKTVKNGTTYTVTGGGGAKLDNSQGKFHHFVEVNIEGEKVAESVIAVEHKLPGFELLEYDIALYLWEPIKQNKMICAMSILYCCAAFFTALILLKRKKNVIDSTL